MRETGQGRGNHTGAERPGGWPSSRGAARCVSALGLALLSCWLFPTAALATPTILSTEVAEVSTTSATLKASVNPAGAKTFVHFEYGPADCATGSCTKVPPEVGIGEGTSPAPVSVPLSGLSPGTTYHLRVVAKSGGVNTAGPDRTFATRSAPPAFGACPNESLRAPFSAALPDCRAYEQASPVNKDNGDATGSISFTKAAPDGNGVSFLSASGMPGGEGSQEIPMFLARRSGGAWSTQGVLPAAAQSGQRVHILGWLPDFAEVFEQSLRFGSPGQSALLGRSSQGGALSELAPYTADANYDYAGASADGSEVAFESTSKLVDTALEGRSNVYVWSQGKLALAGVMNGEPPQPPEEGAFAGPYNWAKGTDKTTLAEGGAASEYYTQDTNAIGEDGGVFFTAAGSGQLYERLNPSAEQSPLNGAGECTNPALACTLHVSATHKDNGKGPGGVDSAGARPAVFQAASADGSLAYFTSSEKLTNDANTGPEPDLPAIARSEADGSARDLTFIPAKAKGIAIGGEYVYWADPEGHSIGRAKLDGSQPAEPDFIVPGATEFETHPKLEPGVLHSAPAEPQWVAVDASHVYWTNTGPRGGENFEELRSEALNGAGTIGRAALDGAGNLVPGSVEAAIVKGASNPQGIAVDSEHLYWANAGQEKEEFQHIGRAKPNGEEANQLWGPASDGYAGLAVDATYVYVTLTDKDHNNGIAEVRRVKKASPASGEAVIALGEAATRGGNDYEGIAVDSSYLYWANRAKDRVGRAPLAGLSQVPLQGQALEEEEEAVEADEEFIGAPAGKPLGLALDGAHLYWSANQGALPNAGNDLYRYEAAGGGLKDLSVEPTGNGAEVLGVLGAARDGSSVYFAANGVLGANKGARGAQAGQGTCRGGFGAMSGECNLYVWRAGPGAGRTEFIARLRVDGTFDRSDALDWVPTPTSLFGSGSEVARTSQASPDGDTLLFRSQQQLTAYDNQGTAELYRVVAGDPEGIECVSCNPTGEAPAGRPTLGRIVLPGGKPVRLAAVMSQSLAEEGRRVFFETPDALVGADVNGQGGCPTVGSSAQSYPACLDVYEWEAKGTGSCEGEAEDGGCLYLISTGRGGEPALFADASQSGEDVFFFSRSQLAGQDKDELLDVYDARVEGGLASQQPLSVPPCESAEACHGPASTPPPAESPGSASFAGPANPKHAKKKHRKAHHKHNKHKHKRHGSRAGAGRRAGR